MVVDPIQPMSNRSYRASLKDLQVEEPVDLLVHRPLGYIVARALLPTPVTADQVTVFSMVLGLGAAAAFVATALGGRYAIPGGLLLIASAVFDCADGQLARMRRSSSRYGRMLDGMVDAVVQIATAPAALAVMVVRLGGMTPAGITWLALGIVTALVGVRHTSLYDHFKNAYVRNTNASPGDCDDLEDVEREWLRLRTTNTATWFDRLRFPAYLVHLRMVRQTFRWVDPYTPARFADMPPFSEAGAARYRELHARLMRTWSFFGVGTHVFGFAVATMFDRLEWYIVARLVVLDAVLLVLAPAQRRAARKYFEPHASTGAMERAVAL